MGVDPLYSSNTGAPSIVEVHDHPYVACYAAKMSSKAFLPFCCSHDNIGDGAPSIFGRTETLSRHGASRGSQLREASWRGRGRGRRVPQRRSMQGRRSTMEAEKGLQDMGARRDSKDPSHDMFWFQSRCGAARHSIGGLLRVDRSSLSGGYLIPLAPV